MKRISHMGKMEYDVTRLTELILVCHWHIGVVIFRVFKGIPGPQQPSFELIYLYFTNFFSTHVHMDTSPFNRP